MKIFCLTTVSSMGKSILCSVQETGVPISSPSTGSEKGLWWRHKESLLWRQQQQSASQFWDSKLLGRDPLALQMCTEESSPSLGALYWESKRRNNCRQQEAIKLQINFSGHFWFQKYTIIFNLLPGEIIIRTLIFIFCLLYYFKSLVIALQVFKTP